MRAIAVMKGNHITYGNLYIKNDKIFFESDDVMIKSFKQVENFKDYKKFEDNKEILGLFFNKKDTKKLMNEMGVKDLYFYDGHPCELNVNEINKHWFKYINVKCKKCSKKCKQSSRVKILQCDDFKGI